VERAISQEPSRLGRRFAEGWIADAWLAAYAEHVADRIGRPVPAWAEGRVSPQPWFAVGPADPVSRVIALRDSPAPFKSRNVYTPSVDLPLNLSAGRPAKTVAELRRANAERQKRFRDRRRMELKRLAALES
jgi:hypothetical protein